MKVVLLHQNLEVGGVSRLVVDDANELARRGIETWVVFFEPEHKGDSMKAQLNIPADHIVFIPYPRMRSVRGFAATVRFLRRARPDIVFTHHWFGNTVGRLAAFVAQTRVVSFEHSDYSAVNTGKQQFLDRMLQRFSFRIVAVSESVRSALMRQGIRARNITVIQNGVDLSRFASVTKEPHEGFTFLFIGRLVGDKCVADIINALGNVPDARLQVAGGGPEEENLRTFAHERGVADRVDFLGVRSDTEDLFRRADCLILPSRREGFGLAVIEALASGVPAIVSTAANASRAVKNGVNGFVFPTGDIKALAFMMRVLAGDSDLHDSFAARAREGVGSFSIQRHVDALVNLARRA